jgi:hypothetical protein
MVAGVAPIPSSSNAPHNHGPGYIEARGGRGFRVKLQYCRIESSAAACHCSSVIFKSTTKPSRIISRSFRGWVVEKARCLLDESFERSTWMKISGEAESVQSCDKNA